MHPVAVLPNSSCCYQVATKGRVLWQVGGKVHLFPLEFLPKSILPREPKLTQVPPFDKVDLAISGRIVHLLRVGLGFNQHLVGVKGYISSVVPQQKSVLLTREPPCFSGEIKYAVLVQKCS